MKIFITKVGSVEPNIIVYAQEALIKSIGAQ
jgi:hypothetical protein